MENVICLELSKYTESQLKEICVKFDLYYERLLESKVKWNVNKAFINISLKKMFACTLVSDPDKLIYYFEHLNNLISSIEPILLKEEVLDVDTILEKITNSGYDSLSKKEKDLLNSLSK